MDGVFYWPWIGIRTHLNATAQWTVVVRRQDGERSIQFAIGKLVIESLILRSGLLPSKRMAFFIGPERQESTPFRIMKCSKYTFLDWQEKNLQASVKAGFVLTAPDSCFSDDSMIK